jgi:hypothetical protein
VSARKADTLLYRFAFSAKGFRKAQRAAKRSVKTAAAGTKKAAGEAAIAQLRRDMTPNGGC